MKNKDIKIIHTVCSDSPERLQRLIKIARKALLDPGVSESFKKELKQNLPEGVDHE